MIKKGPILILIFSFVFLSVLINVAAKNNVCNTYNASTSNYQSIIDSLKPCDTVVLSSGNYNNCGSPGIRISNLNGNEANPITIRGPDVGTRPIIYGCSGTNTIRLRNSSYIIIKNLDVNGRSAGVDGINNEIISHHITIDNLLFYNFSSSQSIVVISTNGDYAWNWIIRNNTILDGGTGMYFGNSDGFNHFVNSTIENNFLKDTIGYNIEFKHQEGTRPTFMPQSGKTIIRNNVFSKSSATSSTGTLARPNLLVGHWPLTGAGSNDYYEIYGNFFYNNPTGEALFQGEGNYAFYNNILYNDIGASGSYGGILVQPHNDLPRNIRIFHNTIVVDQGFGISVSGGATGTSQKLIGNAIFAPTTIGISSSTTSQYNNTQGTYAQAANYLNNPYSFPTGQIGGLDMYPKIGQLIFGNINPIDFNIYTDFDKDFNNNNYNLSFRGSYSGEGINNGWKLNLSRKIVGLAQPQINDTQPPSTPTGLSASAVSPTQINLVWSASSDDIGVAGYRIFRGGIAIATSFTNSYSNTGLNPSTNYIYTVQAYDASGKNSSQSNLVNVTTHVLPIANSGLVLAYSFSEGAGTTTNDSSGNNNLGVLVNGTTWTTNGKYGNAVLFNGISSLVEAQQSSSLNLNSNTYTIEAWVKRNSGSSTGSIIHKGVPGLDGYIMSLGVLVCSTNQIKASKYGITDICGGLYPSDTNWHHISEVVTTNKVNIYIDGVLSGSQNESSAVRSSLAPLRIGGTSQTSSNTYFNGSIDEVRIYNRSLNQSEIQADMNTPIFTPVIDLTPPTQPTSPIVVMVSISQIDLSWTASSDDVGVIGYRLFNWGVETATSPTTSYSFTGLAEGTDYAYSVLAYDASGKNSSQVVFPRVKTPYENQPSGGSPIFKKFEIKNTLQNSPYKNSNLIWVVVFLQSSIVVIMFYFISKKPHDIKKKRK